MTRRVLVVEDDPAIRQGLVDALASEGYRPVEAEDGERGRDVAVRGAFDLVLLDLVLPKQDGFEVLAAIRAACPTLPVIVLTARGSEDDRVRGLKLGADDYVVKPFSARELLARVQAVLRRSAERPLDVTSLRLATGDVDLERCEARFADGARAALTPKERDVLAYLARHKDRVISREELLRNVWRVDPEGLATRTIDMTVVRLREKLRDDIENPRVVLTVRGRGYMLALDGSGSG